MERCFDCTINNNYSSHSYIVRCTNHYQRRIFLSQTFETILVILSNLKIWLKNELKINPRANGAKRRSGRKPGARVTNRALGKLKVVGDGRRAKVIRFLALGMS